MTAIEALDRELERLHKELNTFSVTQYGDNDEYNNLLESIDGVNETLKEVALSEQQMNRGGLLRGEIKLAIAFMKRASDEFSRHTCNDLPKEIRELLSREEWDNLEKKFNIWNNSPEDYTPGRITSNDSCWMAYLAKRLESLL